jgi:hypothetical protein
MHAATDGLDLTVVADASDTLAAPGPRSCCIQVPRLGAVVADYQPFYYACVRIRICRTHNIGRMTTRWTAHPSSDRPSSSRLTASLPPIPSYCQASATSPTTRPHAEKGTYPICDNRLTQRANANISSSPENSDDAPTVSAERPRSSITEVVSLATNELGIDTHLLAYEHHLPHF